ncbi:MAG: DNA-3-methyladenine glycosylase I [Calditrichaeota bacterium]|nr:DNA-3-methyladenine glycosylase I [Calditrichota bacterium]
MKRCRWVPESDALYQKYHDEEWGVPVHDDQKLFEFLTLETFQAGLSWKTVLYKRDNFREAFSGFDFFKVAAYADNEINRLLIDKGIIRNKLKIKATISNAACFIRIIEQYGSFNSYIWSFVGGESIQNNWKELSDLPAKTELSDIISTDLKKHGFKFVGSTVIYAHMQATGMVNDHTTDCFRHRQVAILK